MRTIGSLAREVGVRPSAIRFYESRGLIQPATRSCAGYRLYGAEAARTLRFVRRAQSFGLTLREIRELLAVAESRRRPCARVRELAREHLGAIERKIQELEALRVHLSRLARAPVGRRRDGICPLIESDEHSP